MVAVQPSLAELAKMNYQVRQFNWAPGQGGSFLTSLADPSSGAIIGEIWSQTKVWDAIQLDEEDERVRGFVSQPSPVSSLPQHRDGFRDTADSASVLDPDYPVTGLPVAHRDAYKDFSDSASIYTPPLPDEPQ